MRESRLFLFANALFSDLRLVGSVMVTSVTSLISPPSKIPKPKFALAIFAYLSARAAHRLA